MRGKFYKELHSSGSVLRYLNATFFALVLEK